ncbi:MAG: membrane protein insertion efficiency factor YidD [Verrucomicrobiales bacterium]|nr:membrane protein insertion efficiency factor YidD [Verrucomicrobiales bacterium]MCP5557215.1 membrane protein insertion efficiency factor YidD [Verrucomicrobiaceae bacterium]
MKWLVRILIRGYQKVISPALHFIGGPGSGCRFTPTCSEYFLQAVEAHGVLRGSWMGTWRILRCNPWGGQGHDPVPPRGCTHSKRGTD